MSGTLRFEILCSLVLLAAALLVPTGAGAERTDREIIGEMAALYGKYGRKADRAVDACLKELRGVDPAAAAKWEHIMELWRGDGKTPVSDNVLPDGLPDTDELCIIVLGYQLNQDGSMKKELTERLKVALKSAEKYPKAYIVCTGGGTASGAPKATEAGKMAEWLLEQGVDPARVLVEDRSITTAQNAVFTLDLLAEACPQVTQLAIVSSDYHISTGTLMFGAEATLRGETVGRERYHVVAGAAYRAPSGSFSSVFQAGALIELAGDEKTAFAIYNGAYDWPALPK